MQRALFCALATSVAAQDQLGIMVGSAFEPVADAAMSLDNIVDVSARALGVQPVHSQFDASAFVKPGLSNRARANILVAVPTVGVEALNKHNLQNLQALRGKSTSVRLMAESSNVRVLAQSLAGGSATGATLADVLAQTFDSRSLTVTASSSDSLNRLFQRHPSIDQTNNYVMGMENGGFSPQSSSAFSQRLSMTSEQVTAATGEGASELAAELAYAEHLATSLQGNALVLDDAPDSFTFVLSGLSAVADRSGADSAEYAAALRMVDVSVPRIIEQFNRLYSERAIAEVVLMGVQDQSVGSMSLLRTDAVSRRLLQLDNVTNGTCEYCPTDQQVINYHISLWTSIGLTFAAIFAAYSIGGMNFKKDTLLYSTFNPKWEGGESRKGR